MTSFKDTIPAEAVKTYKRIMGCKNLKAACFKAGVEIRTFSDGMTLVYVKLSDTTIVLIPADGCADVIVRDKEDGCIEADQEVTDNDELLKWYTIYHVLVD